MNKYDFQKEYCFKCPHFIEEFENHNVMCAICINKQMHLDKEVIE